MTKFDCLTDKVVGQISVGPTHTSGEVYYQPRDCIASQQEHQEEDDGYLLTTTHDWKNNNSQFAMWDAKTLRTVVKVQLDTRVPNGFHSTFVRETDY